MTPDLLPDFKATAPRSSESTRCELKSGSIPSPPSSSPSRRRGAAAFTAAILFLLIVGVYTDHGLVEISETSSVVVKNKTLSHTHRKLLLRNAEAEKESVKPNRIWSDMCSQSDIVISQGPTESLPNGIPTYTVEIMNVCVSGCDISAIHLNCGWFSSARLINPRVFKRLGFNDCLVNNGTPLANGRTLSFQYANTYPYHLSVSSVRC